MEYQIFDGCKIYNIEDIEHGTELIFKDVQLENAYDMVADNEYTLYEEDDIHEIWISNGYLHIEELNTKVHTIDFYSKYKNEDTQTLECEIDFSGWMFFDAKTNDWQYEEGYSSFDAAIWNGFKKNVSDLKCDIYA